MRIGIPILVFCAISGLCESYYPVPPGVTFTSPAIPVGNHSKRVRDDGCYAPPLVYGGGCASSTGLTGVPNTYICYHAEPVGDTALSCQGLGIACDGDNMVCCWTWHQLGLLTSGDDCIIWGANAAVPQIRCAGQPLGSAFTWTWYSKSGPRQCNGVCPGCNCGAMC